ncbi:hypothetical protein Ahy_B02g059489 [Arachis hypogaea]|uniref:Uncharacterized protein n=1 Tax=Arachis hypogaea TaxID=3818 RepID=A0A445AGR3_ARAHY|nr:hypothetical protein Ahy_B02g059489 [Arachis hypogaea]
MIENLESITSTNSSSILDPTVVVQSLKSTKLYPANSTHKLFHLDITREATTLPNGQPHVKIGAVLPKCNLETIFFRWTLIIFEPTPSMMLTDSQADVAAYIFSDMLAPSKELVISDEKGYRSTFRCLVLERCVKSRVINLVALMMTHVFRCRNEDPLLRYALSNKYTLAEVIFDFLGAYMSLKISHIIRFKVYRRFLFLSVRNYIKVMLDDHIFNDDKSKVVDCSTFWPITPFGLPTQKKRSNDSGVWMTSWMRECTLQDDFNIQINDST